MYKEVNLFVVLLCLVSILDSFSLILNRHRVVSCFRGVRITKLTSLNDGESAALPTNSHNLGNINEYSQSIIANQTFIPSQPSFFNSFTQRASNIQFPANATNTFSNFLKSANNPVALYDIHELKNQVVKLEKSITTLCQIIAKHQNVQFSYDGGELNSRELLNMMDIGNSAETRRESDTQYRPNTGSKAAGSAGSIGNLVGAIGSSGKQQIGLSRRTVRNCAVVSFFFLGAVIGRSLFDRLWLLGGLAMSYWASEAVHRNTPGGALVRKVGAHVAQLLRDLQEKYNQAYIFYRTGKLAYVSSKTWEKYDSQFSITQRMKKLKKLALQRAVEFNSTLGDSSTKLQAQLSDIWKVLVQAPQSPADQNNIHKLTARVSAITQHAVTVASGRAKEAYSGTIQVLKRVQDQMRAPNSPTRGDASGNSGGNIRSRSDSIHTRTVEGFIPSVLVQRTVRAVASIWDAAFHPEDSHSRKGTVSTYNTKPGMRGPNKLPSSEIKSNKINPWKLPMHSLPGVHTFSRERSNDRSTNRADISYGSQLNPSITNVSSEQMITTLLMCLLFVEVVKGLVLFKQY